MNVNETSSIYVINVENLFLINFVMSMYFHTLALKSMKRTATRIRVIGTSAAGAGLFCFLLLIPGIPPIGKRLIGPVIINMIATVIIFRVKDMEMLLRCSGYILMYAFAFGGIMKFLFGSIPFLHNRQVNGFLVLGAGIIAYFAVSWWIGQMKRARKNHYYEVKLLGYGNEITLKALSDTGNSLKEPISGKPVSVVEEGLLEQLKDVKLPERFRAIPYHSVGKDNGIMEGYEIPELVIEGDKGKIRWQKVIVGISKTRISASGKYQMILHPDLCNEGL